jgi:hypothetical protein
VVCRHRGLDSVPMWEGSVAVSRDTREKTLAGEAVGKATWAQHGWFLLSSAVGGMLFVLTLVADAIGLFTLGISIIWWRVIAAACFVGGGLSLLWSMHKELASLKSAVGALTGRIDFDLRLTDALNRAIPGRPSGKIGSLQHRAEALSIEIREFSERTAVRIDLTEPQKGIDCLMENLAAITKMWGEQFGPRVWAIVQEFAALNITSKDLERALRKGPAPHDIRRVGEMIGALAIRLERMH